MKQIRLKTLPISVILSLFIVFCISDTSKAAGNAAQLPGMLMLLFSDDKSSVSNSYIPPIISGATRFNRDYYEKMIAEGKPTQETPWGFQEIMIEDKVNHTVSSLQEYNDLIAGSTSGQQWSDNKTHIIKFIEGIYIIPQSSSYYIALIPSRTIIEGAGMGKTVFKATHEIDAGDRFHFRKLFNLEYATHDVVVREISFYNETQDNKWGLFHSNGSRDRENYLFQNIEFDDVFGAIGKKPYDSNFITFRGLRKRIGNTTQRIIENFNTPVPVTYQFNGQNNDNVQLAGQIGMRTGNSVVFHDCVVGDTISATIDIYNNYIEMVGMEFINPLHDHSIKCPNGNHLYVHDSSFELTYSEKIIQGGGYWNPTFFTHEGGGLANYHFKNLTFKRSGQITVTNANGRQIEFVESEPFMIYNNRDNNVSGDLVWEDIHFEGYSQEHQRTGYSNVQTNKGFEAVNYTNFASGSAQMKLNNNNSRGDYTVAIEQKNGSSKQDITGAYSWGTNVDGSIDYPRDNRVFTGTKSESNSKPYVQMQVSTVRESYNERLSR